MTPDERQTPEPAKPKADEVIRIEDLTPREDVKGGRKIVLGEVVSDDTETPPKGDQ